MNECRERITHLKHLIDESPLEPARKNFLKNFFDLSIDVDFNPDPHESHLPTNFTNYQAVKFFPCECDGSKESLSDPLVLCAENVDIELCINALLEDSHPQNRKSSFSNSKNQPVSKSPLGMFTSIMSLSSDEEEEANFGNPF